MSKCVATWVTTVTTVTAISEPWISMRAGVLTVVNDFVIRKLDEDLNSTYISMTDDRNRSSSSTCWNNMTPDN